MKLAWLSCALIACAHPPDARDHADGGNEDETLAYITETIFVPYCATAECHSTFKQAFGYTFDTVAGAQYTLQAAGLLACTVDSGDNPITFDPCDINADSTGFASSNTPLLLALRVGDPDRMPYDQPLANKDYTLILQWVIDGAAGYVGSAGTN
jgi:hypothetical protein